MPRASVWLIRLALLQLLCGASLGAAYLSFKADGSFAWVAALRGVHVEQVLVGWMVQLVIGVGYFILPRQASARLGGPLIWSVLVLLNVGVLAAALGTQPGWPAALAPAGRGAEALAAGLFALHAWHRQRSGSPATRRRLV